MKFTVQSLLMTSSLAMGCASCAANPAQPPPTQASADPDDPKADPATSPNPAADGGKCSHYEGKNLNISVRPWDGDNLAIGTGANRIVSTASTPTWCCVNTSAQTFELHDSHSDRNGTFEAKYYDGYDGSQCTGSTLTGVQTVQPGESLTLCAQISNGQDTPLTVNFDPIVKVTSTSCNDE